MVKTTVAELFENKTTLIEVEVKGWVNHLELIDLSLLMTAQLLKICSALILKIYLKIF